MTLACPEGERCVYRDETEAADPCIGIQQALQVALDAEQAGLDFYADVLANTSDPEIRVLAKEFVEEESEHVAELKRWMQLHLSGAKLPTES